MKTVETGHLSLRQEIQTIFESQGIKWETSGSVMPVEDMRRTYSTIFMSAMRAPKQWIYKGIAETNTGLEAGTNFCVRTNNSFVNAGKSNRHLSTFEMFSVDGVQNEDHVLTTMHGALSNVLPDCELQFKVHPEHSAALFWVRKHGVNFQESTDNTFSRDDTDRTGFRVEIAAKDSAKTWEISNVVCISKAGTTTLEKPIIDAGGSFERIVAFAEKTDDVFEISAWEKSRTLLEKEFGVEQEPRAFSGALDLIRTILVLGKSGYKIGTANRQEQTLRKAVRAYTLWLVNNNCTDTTKALQLISNIEAEIPWMNNLYTWPATENVLEESGTIDYVEKTFDQKVPKILARLKQIPEAKRKENIRKVADTFDGGTPELVEAVLAKMNI